eukprot:8917515-Alexandrium_andersonii.AAC.1
MKPGPENSWASELELGTGSSWDPWLDFGAESSLESRVKLGPGLLGVKLAPGTHGCSSARKAPG